MLHKNFCLLYIIHQKGRKMHLNMHFKIQKFKKPPPPQISSHPCTLGAWGAYILWPGPMEVLIHDWTYMHSQLNGRFPGWRWLADGPRRSPRILWRLLEQCSIQAAYLTLPMACRKRTSSVQAFCMPSLPPKYADHAKQSPAKLSIIVKQCWLCVAMIQ